LKATMFLSLALAITEVWLNFRNLSYWCNQWLSFLQVIEKD